MIGNTDRVKTRIEARFMDRARFSVVVKDMVGGDNIRLKFFLFCDFLK